MRFSASDQKKFWDRVDRLVQDRPSGTSIIIGLVDTFTVMKVIKEMGLSQFMEDKMLSKRMIWGNYPEFCRGLLSYRS